MKRRNTRQRRARSQSVPTETLEQRVLLTIEGVSWFDAPNLRISLAPDGTNVAGHESSLFQTLDAVTSRWNWRTSIERGFKKWTDLVDASVSLTEDGGQPFGTAGSTYDDPRFGEIRIAAIPLSDNLFAMSIPHDEFVAGTWAGDVILNSTAEFTSEDEIFRLILHEAGHVMGLGHSTDPASPMFEHGIPSSTIPTAQDRDDLRELYGFQKEDGEGDREQHESEEEDNQNSTFENAVLLNPTPGFPKRRYTLEGQIRSDTDVDIYKFQGYEDLGSELEVTTILLRSLDREQLIPSITLFDDRGREINNVDILQNGNGSIVVQTEDVEPEKDYFIQIEAGVDGTQLGQGRYQLVVASRAEEIEPREFAEGTLTETARESLHTVYLARAQLLNLALEVKDELAPPDTVVGVAIFDYKGDLITTTSAAVGEVRSLDSMLLRGGTYYVSVKAESGTAIPEIEYKLHAIKSTRQAGPLPSDPTGDPAFPCENGPDFCFPDGHQSPDPTHTIPGTDPNAPALDPYAILFSWMSWWPDQNDNAGWVAPNHDAFTAVQGTSTTLDVLVNDTGAGPLEVRQVTQPAHGSASIDPDGTIQFDAAAGLTGPETFEYVLGGQQASVAPTLTPGDSFGSSVAMFCNIAVVGVPFADEAAKDSGAAYVYRRTGADWVLVQKLTPADGAAGDRFGSAVAIDAGTIVVTSPRDDDGGRNSGAAYVFDFDAASTTWLQTRKVTDPNGRAKDLFGESVAIDGSLLVVGARLDDGLGTNSGSAFVFQRNRGGTDNWGLRKKLKAADASAFSQFGTSVDISGNLIAVGARRDDGAGVNAGAAYVFDRNMGGTNAFGQVKRLVAADLVARDEFGMSVSIDAGTVVVGAPLHDAAGNNAGAAYVFERNQGGADQWGLSVEFQGNAAGDKAGTAVAVDGTTLVFASPTADTAGANAGAAAVVSRNATTQAWELDYAVTAAVPAVGDQFGSAVDISGGTVLLGVPRSDAGGTRAGHLVVEDTRRATAQVTVDVAAALRAAQVGTLVTTETPTAADLQDALHAALVWWNVPGGTVSIRLAQLDGDLLGLASGNRILIDADAARNGWNLNGRSDGMDLNAVVRHEVGHTLGLDDDATDRDSVMFGTLSAGPAADAGFDRHASDIADSDQLFGNRRSLLDLFGE